MDAEWLAVIGDKDSVSAPLAAGRVGHQSDVDPGHLLLAGARAPARTCTVAGETPLVLGALTLASCSSCLAAVQRRARGARRAAAGRSRVLAARLLRDGVSRLVARRIDTGRAGQQSCRGVDLLALSLARGALHLTSCSFPTAASSPSTCSTPTGATRWPWPRTTDPGSGWLADPIHAAQYGSSLRAAGHRDVLIERLKDRAIAMYDRQIAMRARRPRAGARPRCRGTRRTARARWRAATASTTSSSIASWSCRWRIGPDRSSSIVCAE